MSVTPSTASSTVTHQTAAELSSPIQTALQGLVSNGCGTVGGPGSFTAASSTPIHQENIRVLCRIRPPDDTGLHRDPLKDKSIVSGSDPSGCIADVDVPPPPKESPQYAKYKSKKLHFKYDRVFDHLSRQEDIFRECVPMLNAVFEGYHATVFAYGQSGSGKYVRMRQFVSLIGDTAPTTARYDV